MKLDLKEAKEKDKLEKDFNDNFVGPLNLTVEFMATKNIEALLKNKPVPYDDKIMNLVKNR